MKTRRNLADPGLVEGKGREWRKKGGKVEGKGMGKLILAESAPKSVQVEEKGREVEEKGRENGARILPCGAGAAGSHEWAVTGLLILCGNITGKCRC